MVGFLCSESQYQDLPPLPTPLGTQLCRLPAASSLLSPAAVNSNPPLLPAGTPLLYLIGLLLWAFGGVDLWRTPLPSHTHAALFHFPAGAFHPDHRPERPFPEEDPGSDGDSFLKQGLPPPSQLEGLKHFLQQVRGDPPVPPHLLLPFFIFSSCSCTPFQDWCLSPSLSDISPFWNFPASASVPDPGLFLYRSSGNLTVLSPQLLETVPQSSEAPSVDLLPPKSGECRL